MGLIRYSRSHISGPYEPIPTKFGLWMFFIMLHWYMLSKTLKCKQVFCDVIASVLYWRKQYFACFLKNSRTTCPTKFKCHLWVLRQFASRKSPEIIMLFFKKSIDKTCSITVWEVPPENDTQRILKWCLDSNSKLGVFRWKICLWKKGWVIQSEDHKRGVNGGN